MSISKQRATSSSAMALREAFGDRKPPDITRKITACVACRKLKIRCHMDGGSPPCSRCAKRGLSCSVNKSLQMLLESDMSWKEQIDRKVSAFEAAIAKISSQIDCPELLQFISEPQAGAGEGLRPETSPSDAHVPETDEQEPPGWQVVNDPQSGPAVIPSTVVSALSPSALKDTTHDSRDLVARGIVPLSVAESCFEAYTHRLDHFVYRALDEYRSLASVRQKSSLLASAICAVGALHASPTHFSIWYREFTDLASAQLFSKHHTLEDVRGLVIGSFWLHDISWTLIGTAVRMAIEMKLHRCVIKPQRSSREWYLQTRLFCLVFVADHHLSVAFGRPPLTPRDFDYPTVSEALLGCPFATEDDARLLSQVEIWSISTKIYYKVGLDTDEPIPDSSLPQLQRLSISLDTWRADWADRFTQSEYVGNYPRKGVRLHYHFAKLYLTSHAFRGAYNPASTSYNISPEFEEFANLAIQSATSILTTITEDVEFQIFLNGLPAYYDTMVAFAVVFLVKVLAKDSPTVRIDRLKTYDLMDRLSATLLQITSGFSKHHLLANIAKSLGAVVASGRLSDPRSPGSFANSSAQETNEQGMLDFNPGLIEAGSSEFITNFDFFYPPLGDFDTNFMDVSNS